MDKCEFLEDGWCTIDNKFNVKCESCKCCYYKQLQKSQNTIIVGLQIQTMLLANNSKLNKCLDEIEEIVNFISNITNCDKAYYCKDKLDEILKKIKAAKGVRDNG